MEKNKSITFNKTAQDNLPEEAIKKMQEDRRQREIYTTICRQVTEGIFNYDEQIVAIAKWIDSEFIPKQSIKDNSNLLDIVKKFEDGERRFNESPVFNQVIHGLAQGQDIYKILDQILVLQENTQKTLTEYITNKPKPISAFEYCWNEDGDKNKCSSVCGICRNSSLNKEE